VRKRIVAWAWVLAFALTAALANVATANIGLVPIGFGLMVTAGTFFAGLSLILRDVVHEVAGLWIALAAVVIGATLSGLTAGTVLATASLAAFIASELADSGIYAILRRRLLWLAVLLSGCVGLVLDTLVFLYLAGFPLTAGTFVGQVLVKGSLTVAASLYVWIKK
jgi:uncharacterized PurR-regulated membrane protein YhhQ (DUF165 family)